MTYRELYNTVENPLDNKKNFEKFIENVVDKKDIYSALTKTDPQTDRKINVKDRDEFYSLIYHKWRKNVLEMSNEKIDELIKLGKIDEDFKKYKEEMLKVPEVNTYDDYRNITKKALETDELYDAHDKYGMFIEDGFTHVKSKLTNYDQKHEPVSHRLYINMDSLSGYKVITEFIKKCDKKNIPYYFKFIFPDNRDDTLVIYSSTDHITDYIEILREIKKENKDLFNNVKQPPILTAKIDGWIGYGTEPKIKHTSYNKIRSEIIEQAINEEVKKWLEEKKNEKYIKGKFNNLAERLAEINVEDFINQKNKNFERFEKGFKKAGVDKKILNSKEMRDSLFKQYTEIITKMLNKETNIKKDLYYKDKEFSYAVLFDRHIICSILKIALENDKENIMNKIKENITSKCRKNGISPRKFSMDIKVIQEMMAYSKMKYNDDLKDITAIKKEKLDENKLNNTTSKKDEIETKQNNKIYNNSTIKKSNDIEKDIIKLVVEEEKNKEIEEENDLDNEVLKEYTNSGYSKNAFGWYYNPNIDEYDKEYKPEKDPLFNKNLSKKQPIAKIENKKQSELKNIIVYTAINKKNEIKNRAFLIYNDGAIKNVDEERFTKEIAQLAKEKNVSNYSSLEMMGILEFTTAKDLVKDWNNYFDNDKKDAVSKYKSV